MAFVATSKYRAPPRPQDRRPRVDRHDDRRPTLVQFVVLSMCLHALAILLFGAPTGGSRDGRAMWGSLQVELEASYRDVLPTLRIDRAIEALRKDVAASSRAPPRAAPRKQAAPEPPLPLSTTRQLQLPRVEPLPAPQATSPALTTPPPSPIALPPAVAVPPPQAAPPRPQLVVPPMMERLAPAPKLEKLETFTVPLPTENQVVAPVPEEVKAPAPAPPETRAQPVEPKAPPVEMKALPALPPIEAAPLPPMMAPIELKPIVPPPVPLKPLAPIAPVQAPSLPTLAPVERAHMEAPPKVEIRPVPVPPVESAAPPVEVPIAKPVEAPIEAPALPTLPAPQAVPMSPAVSATPPVSAAPVVPAAPRVATPSAVPAGRAPARDDLVPREPAAPSAGSSRFHAAPSPDSKPGADYDPTRPQRPLDVDVDAMRNRARQLAREGTGNRALLAFPMPPVPKEKSKLEKGIEKAWKPDCKTAYSSLGLAAVVPLIANEFGEGKCRW